MKQRTLVVALLAAPALWAFGAPAADIEFNPEPGTKLTKTIKMVDSSVIDDATMIMNGEEMPPEMSGGAGAGMETTVTASLVIVDDYVQVDAGRPIRLRRTFEELSQETEIEGGPPMIPPSTDSKSDLEGKTVVFTWDEDDEEYGLEFADEEDLDASLLEGLAADLDFRAFLPGRGVSEGDTWSIDPEHVRLIMSPGGDVQLRATETPMGMEEPSIDDMIGEMEGRVSGKFVGTREVDGERLAILEIDVDVSSANDVTEMMTAMMADAEMPMGMPAPEFHSVDFQLAMTGTGRILWNVKRGHVQSFEFTGDTEVLNDMVFSMTVMDNDMELEQSSETSGTREISFEVEFE